MRLPNLSFRSSSLLRLVVALAAAAILAPSAAAAADPVADPAVDLSQVDLTGHWYILIHYKDDRSEDKSITKFKDTVWSIEQQGEKIKITSYPYVFFGEGDELVRRASMMEHIAWMPDERVWAEVREFVRVSERGAKVKTLRGSRETSFESNPSGGGFGMNTLTFSQNWKLTMAPELIKMEITDSLSGTGGLAGMDETIVYQFLERVAADEFRGRYDDPTRHGKLWAVRSKERRGQSIDRGKKDAEQEARREAGFQQFMEQSTDE